MVCIICSARYYAETEDKIKKYSVTQTEKHWNFFLIKSYKKTLWRVTIIFFIVLLQIQSLSRFYTLNRQHCEGMLNKNLPSVTSERCISLTLCPLSLSLTHTHTHLGISGYFPALQLCTVLLLCITISYGMANTRSEVSRPSWKECVHVCKGQRTVNHHIDEETLGLWFHWTIRPQFFLWRNFILFPGNRVSHFSVV